MSRSNASQSLAASQDLDAENRCIKTLAESPLMNISSLISENQSISNFNGPPFPSSPSLQNTTGFQSSNVRIEYHEVRGGFSPLNRLPDAWTPEFPVEDRDTGLESFDQGGSDLLGNAPGIYGLGWGMERKNCDEKRPHCSRCEGRKSKCEYGIAKPRNRTRQSLALTQHDGYKQYPDDNWATQYGLVPKHIHFPGERTYEELETTSCHSSDENTRLPVDDDVRDIARSPSVNAHREGLTRSRVKSAVAVCPTIPPLLLELSATAFREFSEKTNRRALVDHFCNVFSHLIVFHEDPGNPFRQLILPLARKGSPVMNAIYALSSAHLENRGMATEEKSLYFYNEATRGLARLINHNDGSSQEDVLGAILLLVYYESVGEFLQLEHF